MATAQPAFPNDNRPPAPGQQVMTDRPCCPEYARTGSAHTEICPAFQANDPARHDRRRRDPSSHYYGDGCPEHPARQEGLPIQPGDQPIRPQLMPRQPIHPRHLDRVTWNAMPGLDVAIDDGLCIVLHTPYGTLTVTDVERLRALLVMAKVHQGQIEERQASAAGSPTLDPKHPETWSDAVPPGGYVCAVPDPGKPDGICGMPTESEPCTLHDDTPEATP